LAAGAPSDPEAYDIEIVESLEFDSLERDIEIAEPLEEEEIDFILELMETGDSICGEDFLPSCDEVPVEIGGELDFAFPEDEVFAETEPSTDEDDASFDDENEESDVESESDDTSFDDSSGDEPISDFDEGGSDDSGGDEGDE
jgi:hypothetical protein